MSDKIFIENWFDVNNIKHVKAYEHLRNKGFWPKGFISDNITVGTYGTIIVAHMLADAYVQNMINSKGSIK